MTEYQKRQPAFFVEIKELLTGKYTKTEGWDPNFVTLNFGLNVTRVTIFGTVLESDEFSMTLDDSTGIIKIRSFDKFNDFEKIKSGDFVKLIGKVRQFNNEIYLAPESCVKILKDWNSLRLKNLEKLKELFKKGLIINYKPETKEDVFFESGKEVIQNLVDDSINEKEESLIEKVLNFIDEKDSGSGVEKVKILDFFDDSSVVEVVDTLIMEGDIFEVKPGVFKVLK